MARQSPMCTAALHRVEEQCASSTSRDRALLAIRALVHFAAAGEGTVRRIDTYSEAFQQRLGACPAALEVLALCGFRPSVESGRWLELPPDAGAPPPDVVRAVEEAAGKVSSDRHKPTPVVTRTSADTEALKLARKACERRCPLTKRLSTLDPAMVAEGSLLAEQQLQGRAGAEATINEALKHGESVVCGACGGVLAVDRYEQHMLRWCPATGGGALDSDSDA
eukprot:Hpha_TRINITY_DN14754_c0_g1::TRINITY_DN14754_c0_g1_i1::g.103187::m.103187